MVVYLAEALAQDGSALAVGHPREGGDARREEEQEHRRAVAAVLLLVRRRPVLHHQPIRSSDHNSERVNGGTSSTAQTSGRIKIITIGNGGAQHGPNARENRAAYGGGVAAATGAGAGDSVSALAAASARPAAICAAVLQVLSLTWKPSVHSHRQVLKRSKHMCAPEPQGVPSQSLCSSCP